MLLDIAKLPTAGNSVIRLHPTDNVAVARVPIPAGTRLSVEGLQLVTREAIPAGHKVALRAIRPGELVERYIGTAPFDPAFVEERRVELVRQTKNLHLRKRRAGSSR